LTELSLIGRDTKIFNYKGKEEHKIMRKGTFGLSSAVGLIAMLFIAASVYAGTLGPKMLKMDTEAYEKHERGIVEFPHKKHVLEYKYNCGDCHHDENGEPLGSFKMETTPTCLNCHDIDFLHESHSEGMDVTCGECHVDEQGKPLEVFKIQKCIECHDKPGLSPKGVSVPRLSIAERLEYHGEAVHFQCRSCHKKFNEEEGGNAPIACNKCHTNNE
jgi:hypothetical protein